MTASINISFFARYHYITFSIYFSFFSSFRFMAIVKPLSYPIIVTRKRVRLLLIIVWIFCIGNFCSQIVLSVFFTNNKRAYNICANNNYSKTQDSFYLYLGFSVITYFGLMSLCYIRIYYVAQNLGRKRATSNPTTRVERAQESRIRLRALRSTATTAIVVGVCGICWIPTSLKLFLEVYGNFNSLFALGVFSEMVLFANSMVNPIIYGWRYPEFSHAYGKVVRGMYLHVLAIKATKTDRWNHNFRTLWPVFFLNIILHRYYDITQTDELVGSGVCRRGLHAALRLFQDSFERIDYCCVYIDEDKGITIARCVPLSWNINFTSSHADM